MSWTKRQFITAAFNEIGIANYTFDVPPDTQEAALRKLDAMMQRWDSIGLRLSYPFNVSPEDADIDEETNVPDKANEAVYLNLAVALAPMMGKALSPITGSRAREALQELKGIYKAPPTVQRSPTVAGAGHKPWRNWGTGEFLPEPDDPIELGLDSDLELDG